MSAPNDKCLKHPDELVNLLVSDTWKNYLVVHQTAKAASNVIEYDVISNCLEYPGMLETVRAANHLKFHINKNCVYGATPTTLYCMTPGRSFHRVLLLAWSPLVPKHLKPAML